MFAVQTSLKPALFSLFVDPKWYLENLEIKQYTQLWNGMKGNTSQGNLQVTFKTFTSNEKSLSTLSFSNTSGVTQSGKVKLCWDCIYIRREDGTERLSHYLVYTHDVPDFNVQLVCAVYRVYN